MRKFLVGVFDLVQWGSQYRREVLSLLGVIFLTGSLATANEGNQGVVTKSNSREVSSSKGTILPATSGGVPTPKAVRASIGMLPSVEEWKGKSPSQHYSAGFLGGVSVNGASNFGGVFVGHLGLLLVERGFIGGEINDQVVVEVEAGPELFSRVTALGVSTHLRWDFHRNEDFTVYGLGGVSFHVAPGFNQIHPRFGAGAIWHFEWFGVRAEFSERWFLGGAHFSF